MSAYKSIVSGNAKPLQGSDVMGDSTAPEEESKQPDCTDKDWSVQVFTLESTEEGKEKKKRKKPPSAIPG